MIQPLVSCLMLTYNRRHLLPVALASYLAQNWPHKELIVIDDGEDHVGDLFSDVPSLVYIHTVRQPTVAHKLNLACEIANGEYLATFDDDDWSASTRLRDQATRLIATGAALTGYSTMLFHDAERARAWRYIGMPHYSVGTSQFYRKDFWQKHPFPAKNVAFDNDLWMAAHQADAVVCVPGEGQMVARLHSQNVSGPRDKNLGKDDWPEVPLSALPAAYLEALR